jgi:hypothetical protein
VEIDVVEVSTGYLLIWYNGKSHGLFIIFLFFVFRTMGFEKAALAGGWWLMPVILATQEAEIRRIVARGQPGQIVWETLSRKTLHKKGLAEWLKVKALSSSPSTAINQSINQ